MSSFSFGKPEWLWALALVPAVALLFWRAERQTTARLTSFIAPNLLPQLAATVNRFRRVLRFALLLAAIACSIVALAQPRWGYIYDEVKRRGLDVIVAVDTSRSMLSNDVQPNRLQRVKLAVQDFIGDLGGDRVGLIAFAGRAFLQAPLTIDYNAEIEALDDLDTNTIPEGGTNISDAINLAAQTFGKSAMGNRALVIFTDGEELSGDAVKTARAATDAGVRIFTIGVGTPEGSLIPVRGEDGGTAFVKDESGQVVKSKLDEKRLREIAQETGGIYLHLDNGPATMQQLVREGLSKMQAGDIDARLSRRPIERYQWPLGAACIAIAMWFLITERKRVRVPRAVQPARTLAAAAMLLVSCAAAFGSAPGLDAYRSEKFHDAYEQFEQTLQQHPETSAADKLHFDAGAAAYKMKDYGKALDSFSQALLSRDAQLQSLSHYNLGNTLYQRGEGEKADEKKLTDWNNALQHYEQTLKIDPKNKEAKENYEFVKNKIDDLKRQKEQKPSPTPTPKPSPTPTPTPTPSPQQNDKNNQQQQNQQQSQDKQQQNQQQPQSQDQQKQQDQQQNQQQQQSGGGQQQKQDKQNSGGQTPTPTPASSSSPQQQGGSTPSPSPSASASSSPGDQQQQQQQGGGDQQPSPSPNDGENGSSPTPSPSAGQGQPNDAGEAPSATPSASAGKDLRGDVKGASDEKPQQSPPDQQQQQVAEAEPTKEGEMTPQQAEALLRSMKDEEQRVQLDERKAARHVYKDW